MPKTRKNPNPPSEDADVQRALSEWKQLDPYQRGDHITRLRSRYTVEQLARVFACSKKLIRDYEIFGGIEGTEREEAKKLSQKQVLATMRSRHRTRRNWEKETTGQSGRKLKNRLARVLREWAKKNISPWMWDPFFQQVLGEGCRAFDVTRFGPKNWAELRFEDDWEKVVEETRPPKRLRPSSLDSSLLEYELRWFATWIQRCMPFPAICDQICKRVRRQLRHRAWKDYGKTASWPRLPNPSQRKGLSSPRRRRSKKKVTGPIPERRSTATS